MAGNRQQSLNFAPGVGDQRPPVYSVSQINQLAKQLLERHFSSVTVAGELSNFKKVSGHCYLTLKDKDAQMAAVMFRREAMSLKFALQDGMEVWATGRLTLYGPYGRYQMIVERLEPQGVGALQAAFEQLKKKLAAEGLFDAERKRPLPRLPRRVGVITSPTGAVIRDIVHVSQRRFPNADILVFPTRVQGAESAPSIIQAIEKASALAPRLGIDVLILARGGGSLEDLWGFNDERVARAVASTSVPLVCGVGHETDYTIADFVADQRAPTPSAAAELVFSVKSELRADLATRTGRFAHSLRRRIQLQRANLRALQAVLGDGRGLLRERWQQIAELQRTLHHTMQAGLHRRHRILVAKERALSRLHPRAQISHIRGQIHGHHGRVALLAKGQVQRQRQMLVAVAARLHALSPLAVLDRGYAIVLSPSGEAVRQAGQVQPGSSVDVRVAKGRFSATVDKIHPPDDAAKIS